MKKCITFFITLVMVLTVFSPINGLADSDAGVASNASVGDAVDWYEGKTTETGTPLTRDFTFGLSDELAAAPYDNTKDNFFAFRDELPQEMPVFAPYSDDEIAKSKNKIYISTDGNDKNDGSIDKPVKTLKRACEIAKGPNMKKGGLTIYFREGTYSNMDGFEVPASLNGTEDNPTFVAAYPGEKVTLTTAISVSGSDMEIADDAVANRKLNKKAKGKVYSVDLKKLGYSDFGEFTTSTRPVLFVDGVQYTIARWPNSENTGMINYTGDDGENGVIESGDILTAAGKTGKYTGKTGTGFEFLPSSAVPFTWENTGNIWMYGYWYEEWAKYHIQVKDFNKVRSSVSTVQDCQYGAMYVREKSYYFYNILEELDIPGEWYIDDKTGILYIYPFKDLKNSEIKVSTTASDALKLDGSQYIVVSGLNIDTSGQYGVNVINGFRTIVQKCHVKNSASRAVELTGNNCGLLANNLEGRVYLYATDGALKSFNMYAPKRNFVQNNIIHDMIRDSSGFQSIISHNLITGTAGHSLFMNDTLESICEYNEIVGGPNANLDAGVIYFCGTAAARNNHFRYNFLNRATDTIRKNPRGVYIDDMASYAFAYGNIMLEANCFIHGGSECVFYNNVIIDNNSETGSFTNSDNYQIDKERWAGMILADNDTRWFRQKRSVYFQDWMTRYIYDYQHHTSLMEHKYEFESPGYSTATDDFGKWVASPKYNYYANNLMVNSNNYSVASTEKESLYEDNVSINYDPGFKDYQNGDYSLDEKSLKAVNPKMEAIPSQQKMGLLYDDIFGMSKNNIEKATLISPINSVDEPVLDNENVSLTWSSVPGKSVYIVEVSKDKDFSDIVYTTRTQTNSAVVPALEYGETYYWRVEAQSWSGAFNHSSSMSETYTFRVGTFDEVAQNATLDYIMVNAAVADLSSMYDKIKADYENDKSGEVYNGNVAEELEKLLSEASNASVSGNLKIQKDVDEYAADLYKRFYSIWGKYTKPTTYDIVGELKNIEDWTVVGNGSIKENSDGFELSGSSTPMFVSADTMLMRPNTEYSIRIKYDKLANWTTMQLAQLDNTSTGPVRATDYFIVFKSDLIELQRYPRDDGANNGILQSVENDSKIVAGGEWFDLTYTIKYTDDGPQIIVSVDGKEIINYVDRTAKVYNYNYLGLMHNDANVTTYIASPSDK